MKARATYPIQYDAKDKGIVTDQNTEVALNGMSLNAQSSERM